MQCCQAGVACGNAVSPPVFESGQEMADLGRRQVIEVQPVDRSPAMLGGKPQVEHQGIAVAVNRVGAHAAQCGQVLLKETNDAAAE
jgi:hypothetical protein